MVRTAEVETLPTIVLAGAAGSTSITGVGGGRSGINDDAGQGGPQAATAGDAGKIDRIVFGGCGDCREGNGINASSEERHHVTWVGQPVGQGARARLVDGAAGGKGETNGFSMGIPDGVGRLDRWENFDVGATHSEQIPIHDMDRPPQELPFYLSNADPFPSGVPVLDRKGLAGAGFSWDRKICQGSGWAVPDPPRGGVRGKLGPSLILRRAGKSGLAQG